MNKKKLKKIRSSILKYLDSQKWVWDSHFSSLLDQVDSCLFDMRQNFD